MDGDIYVRIGLTHSDGIRSKEKNGWQTAKKAKYQNGKNVQRESRAQLQL